MDNFKIIVIEKCQDIWWFLKDNISKVLLVLGIALVALLVFAGTQKQKRDANPQDYIKEDSIEQLAVLTENSSELKDYFSELEFRVINQEPETPIVEIGLYLKQPFMDSKLMLEVLNKYTESLKLKYNFKGRKIRGIKINLYDRYEVYDKGFSPKGVYYYTMDKEFVPENKEEFAEIRSDADESWEYTTLTYQKKVDYSKYTSFLEFMQLTPVDGIVPLSDEEFSWYMKFNLYDALTGSPYRGLNLYLNWELGMEPTDTANLHVEEAFTFFKERLDALGDRQPLYKEYTQEAIADMLFVDNPQVLCFHLTKTIELNPDEARKILIKKYPELFTDTMVNLVKNRTTNFDEKYDDPASPDYKKKEGDTEKAREAKEKMDKKDAKTIDTDTTGLDEKEE